MGSSFERLYTQLVHRAYAAARERRRQVRSARINLGAAWRRQQVLRGHGSMPPSPLPSLGNVSSFFYSALLLRSFFLPPFSVKASFQSSRPVSFKRATFFSLSFPIFFFSNYLIARLLDQIFCDVYIVLYKIYSFGGNERHEFSKVEEGGGGGQFGQVLAPVCRYMYDLLRRLVFFAYGLQASRAAR